MSEQTSAPAVVPFRDAVAVSRGPLPTRISMAPVVSGTEYAYEDVLLDDANGFFAVWACDAGVFPRHKDRRGSFMYLLAGAGTIVDEDGTSHDLCADSILILPFGWKGHWNITETVRKVYVHTTPTPPYREGVQKATFVPVADLDGDGTVFDGPDGMCELRTTAVGGSVVNRNGRARFVYVLGGAAVLRGEDGSARQVEKGATFALPDGWRGMWNVSETLHTFNVFATPAR